MVTATKAQIFDVLFWTLFSDRCVVAVNTKMDQIALFCKALMLLALKKYIDLFTDPTPLNHNPESDQIQCANTE